MPVTARKQATWASCFTNASRDASEPTVSSAYSVIEDAKGCLRENDSYRSRQVGGLARHVSNVRAHSPYL